MNGRRAPGDVRSAWTSARDDVSTNERCSCSRHIDVYMFICARICIHVIHVRRSSLCCTYSQMCRPTKCPSKQESALISDYGNMTCMHMYLHCFQFQFIVQLPLCWILQHVCEEAQRKVCVYDKLQSCPLMNPAKVKNSPLTAGALDVGEDDWLGPALTGRVGAADPPVHKRKSWYIGVCVRAKYAIVCSIKAKGFPCVGL